MTLATSLKSPAMGMEHLVVIVAGVQQVRARWASRICESNPEG